MVIWSERIPAELTLVVAKNRLNAVSRGFSNPPQITYQNVKRHSHDGATVDVDSLRSVFFSENHTEEDWEEFLSVLVKPYRIRRRAASGRGRSRGRPRSRSQSPHNQSGSRSQSPVRNRKRRSGTGIKRGRYPMETRLDDPYTDAEMRGYEGVSFLSIQPSGDECDETDVNLPRQVCEGFQTVCHAYNDNMKYRKFSADSSENKLYNIHIDSKTKKAKQLAKRPRRKST